MSETNGTTNGTAHASPTRQFRRLKRNESFRLVSWINGNIDRIKTLTRDQASALACKELSVDMNPLTLSDIVKAMGIEPPWLRTPRSAVYKASRRIEAVAKAVLTLTDVITGLTAADSLGGLLPDPARERLRTALRAIDTARLTAIAEQ